jgi:hypothetical protein
MDSYRVRLAVGKPGRVEREVAGEQRIPRVLEGLGETSDKGECGAIRRSRARLGNGQTEVRRFFQGRRYAMQERFDRALFAGVLVALAMLISISSAARFPGILRPARPPLSANAVGEVGLPNVYGTLR